MLKLKYVKSSEQLADCLTKGLGPSENVIMCNKMGMIDIFSPSLGGVLSSSAIM